jgi:hypothetical protein
VPVYGLDRQHWGGEIKTANVSSGSTAGPRRFDHFALNLPFAAARDKAYSFVKTASRPEGGKRE